jgi:hypothetical protein
VFRNSVECARVCHQRDSTAQREPDAVSDGVPGRPATSERIDSERVSGTGGDEFGGIDVYAYRRTDVVVEISGYFGR